MGQPCPNASSVPSTDACTGPAHDAANLPAAQLIARSVGADGHVQSRALGRSVCGKSAAGARSGLIVGAGKTDHWRRLSVDWII